MNNVYKIVLSIISLVTLNGCGSARMDMTGNKVSSSSPSIYSVSIQFLKSDGFIKNKMMKGSVIKIDDKKILSTMGFKRVFLNPGVHTVEMTWFSTFPPVSSNNGEVSTTSQPLGYIPISVSEYTPKRNFTMQLNVRNGHDYFVNLQDSVVNNTFQLPKRLCISEVKKNSKYIKEAPAGNVVPKRQIKVLACSH